MLSFTWLPVDNRIALPAVGLASIIVAAASIVVAALHQDESKVSAPPPKTQYITQDTEDSLKSDTLESLLGHYNFSIRDTSSRIICDRAANDEEITKTLIFGITRDDHGERIKALKALALITDCS